MAIELYEDQWEILLDELKEYITIESHVEGILKLHVHKDITMNEAGKVMPADTYMMDTESVIYRVEDDDSQLSLFDGIPARKLTPMISALDEPMTLANLFFYIGEYMSMSDKANAILGNYFKKNDLQDITLPKEIVHLTDKVSRSLFQNKFEPESLTAVEGGIKNGIKLVSKVKVSLDNLPPEITISRQPTQFDNAVFRAVCSIFEGGSSRFTGTSIWKVMKGDKDAEKPTDDALKAIHESWLRLTSTALHLDTGNMGDAYNFLRWERLTHVIEGSVDKITAGNQHGSYSTTVYTVHEQPTLLYYAKLLNQINRYPIAVLDTPINKTPEMLVIQNYLVERIEAIPHISNRIKYDAIFSEANITAASPGAIKKRKTTLRKYIRKMLDYWVSIDFIDGWKEIKEGRSIVGIEIAKKKSKSLKAANK